MTAPLDDELIQHAAALRCLARELVGASDVDDIVQDTALAALQRPPRNPSSMLGWLTAVLRHRAKKQRRTLRRRVAREHQVVAQAGKEPARTPLGAAQYREVVQRLNAALLGLPQPYQDALLLRYFKGMTPSEMAEHSGESLSTIKSRLQRGLAGLRGSLGADKDWRAALVLTFGLGGSKTVSVGAFVVAVGVMIMTLKPVIGVVAAALVMLWWWPDTAVAPTAKPAPQDNVVASVSTVLDEGVHARRTEVATRVGESLGLVIDRESPEEKVADEWGELRRLPDPLIRTLLSFPGQATFRNLLRHRDLNPRDQKVASQDWKATDQTLASIHRKIVELAEVESDTCVNEMRALVDSGLSKGVDLKRTENGVAALPDEYWERKRVDVYGIHYGAGSRGYSFALRELPQTTGIVRMRELVTADYLSKIVAFSTEHGLIDHYQSAALIEMLIRESRTLK